MDSTAGSTTARSPGADDNGSGSVTILEALRVIAHSDFTPKNTIEFHWYSGEEGGLLGSQAIFSNYKSTQKSVLAMLNQDMTGYSPSNQIAVYTDNVDASLTQYVKVIATQYTGAAPLTTRCGYGCSDHASARSNGFRQLLPHPSKVNDFTYYDQQHLLSSMKTYSKRPTKTFILLQM
jgi:leucyl aminopeptidase